MSDARGNRTLPLGLLVASLGAILLIVSLFLDWYEVNLEGFTVFEFLDLLLVLMALATIASLAGGLGLIRAAPSPGVSLAVALFAIYVVVSQILNDPPAVAGGDRGKEIGIWLALAGSALMVAGSLLAFARISLAVEPRGAGRGDGARSSVDAPATAGSRATAATPGSAAAAAAPAGERVDSPRERADLASQGAAHDPDATRPLSEPEAPPSR